LKRQLSFLLFDNPHLQVNPSNCLPPCARGGHGAALLQHWEHQGVQRGGGTESWGGL